MTDDAKVDLAGFLAGRLELVGEMVWNDLLESGCFIAGARESAEMKREVKCTILAAASALAVYVAEICAKEAVSAVGAGPPKMLASFEKFHPRKAFDLGAIEAKRRVMDVVIASGNATEALSLKYDCALHSDDVPEDDGPDAA